MGPNEVTIQSPESIDWSEGAIRDLVAKNHGPVEVTAGLADGTLGVVFSCSQCGEPWPCPILLSLRDWLTRNGGSANDMCPRCGLVTSQRPRLTIPRPDPQRESKA